MFVNGRMPITSVALFCCICLFSSAAVSGDAVMSRPIAIVIHGGAGTIHRANLDEETEAAYRAILEEAVTAGHAILKTGGSSSDAVLEAIQIMEDSELFNAGRGAVLNHKGDAELDASIMIGSDRSAGAVAALRRIKNPIRLAAKVLTESPHVMLMGDGAEEFAVNHGFELVDNDYFITERRKMQLRNLQIKDEIRLSEDNDEKFGTVGAVAIDRDGVITAGTSTGGMTNKRFGRIGDSPIIGAGTYADDRCGISATGHGEYFIRAAVAHDICARARYLKVSLYLAAYEVVKTKLVEMGGDGGVIGIDHQADVVMQFNSKGMYRASINRKGELFVGIFRD